MLPSEYKPRAVRPMSEIINPGRFMNEGKKTNKNQTVIVYKSKKRGPFLPSVCLFL